MFGCGSGTRNGTLIGGVQHPLRLNSPPVTTEPRVTSLDDIPGWFQTLDQDLFAHFLGADAVVPRGDLVELGVYLGKSAVLVGRYKRPDETFTVCDLFGTPPSENTNRSENARLYKGLERQAFEHNYLALFDELPVIVQDFSSAIVDHVPPGRARFVHVDASHMYEHVAVDVESARTILQPDGVVVFDDYRSAHTPGVSAAVWEAVFTKGLHPICITVQKMYATFGDPRPHQERLEAWLKESGRYPWETQYVAGAPLVRLRYAKANKPAAPSYDLPTLGKRVDAMERNLGTLQKELKRVERANRPLSRRAVRKLRSLARRARS